MKTQVRHWSLYWPFFMFIHNNTPRDRFNNLSSFEVLYGRMALDPFVQPGIQSELTMKDKNNYTKALSNFLDNLHPQLSNDMQERHKKIISKMPQQKNDNLKPGTKCLIYKPNIRNGKLSVHYSGPFEIIRQRFKDSYEVQCTATKRKYFRNLTHIRVLDDVKDPVVSP